MGWRTAARDGFTDADGRGRDQEPVTYYRFEPGPLSEALRLADADPDKIVVLAIEELNRGNVAAIFGDVFQLLDRKRGASNQAGFSEYPLRPATEWALWLQAHCPAGHVFRDGRLRLPPNLYLYATMNTSDQSLFPMDTAFRRRWGLHYVGLDNQGNRAQVPLHASDDVGVRWLDLMAALNERIVDHTRSDDKQMGPWFVRSRPSQRLVDGVEFRSKVLFYLWDEVFRDRPESAFHADIRTYDALVRAYRAGRHVFHDELLIEVGAIEAPGEE